MQGYEIAKKDLLQFLEGYKEAADPADRCGTVHLFSFADLCCSWWAVGADPADRWAPWRVVVLRL